MRYALLVLRFLPIRALPFCLLALSLAGLVLPRASAYSIRPHRTGHAEQQQIEHLEDEIRQALLTGETAVLEKLLADDFLGISANGTLSDRQQYIRRIGKREHQFSRIDVVDRKVRVQPSSAIVVTTANVVGKLDATPVSGLFRYTRVYSREANGSWRLRNFEATRVAGSAGDEMTRGTPVPKAKAGK